MHRTIDWLSDKLHKIAFGWADNALIWQLHGPKAVQSLQFSTKAGYIADNYAKSMWVGKEQTGNTYNPGIFVIIPTSWRISFGFSSNRTWVLWTVPEQQFHPLHPKSHQDLPPSIHPPLLQLHRLKPAGFCSWQKCNVRDKTHDPSLQVALGQGIGILPKSWVYPSAFNQLRHFQCWQAHHG